MFSSGDREGRGETFSWPPEGGPVLDFEVFYFDDPSVFCLLAGCAFPPFLPLKCFAVVGCNTTPSKMDPSSCLADGQVHSSQNDLPFVPQTHLCSLQPKSSILTSFVYRTRFFSKKSGSRKGFLARKWGPENACFGHEVIFIFRVLGNLEEARDADHWETIRGVWVLTKL